MSTTLQSASHADRPAASLAVGITVSYADRPTAILADCLADSPTASHADCPTVSLAGRLADSPAASHADCTTVSPAGRLADSPGASHADCPTISLADRLADSPAASHAAALLANHHASLLADHAHPQSTDQSYLSSLSPAQQTMLTSYLAKQQACLEALNSARDQLQPISIIVNAPWHCPKAHDAMLRLLEAHAGPNPNHGLDSSADSGARSAPSPSPWLVDKLIFMGPAAPLAGHQPSQLLKSYLKDLNLTSATLSTEPSLALSHQASDITASTTSAVATSTAYEPAAAASAQHRSFGMAYGPYGDYEIMTGTNSSPDVGELWAALDDCAGRYRTWASKQQVELLVCGMAAKRFWQDNKLTKADGLELTGYMELLALLGTTDKKVLLW